MVHLFRAAALATALITQTVPRASAQNAAQSYTGDRLAYVTAGKLYVGYPKATLVPHEAVASHPAFSYDGKWLAFTRRASASSSVEQLWLMPADRSAAPRKLVSSITSFGWSPSRDALAVEEAANKRNSPVLLIPAGGKAQFLPGHLSGDFAWSPDGQTLGVVNFSSSGYARLGLVRGNQVTFRRLPGTHRQDPVFLAGWWPDDSGILYWLDPGGCLSCITDGTRLLTYDLESRRARQIGVTLIYRDWLAPNGNHLLMVSGGPREAFFGKHVQLCESSSTCKSLPHGGSRNISVDPAWSPDGRRMAFVVAPAWKTPGFISRARYQSWLDAHVLWLAQADGAQAKPAPGVPKGAQDPVWTRDGQGLLFVKDGALWLTSHLGAGNAHPIARLVKANAVPNLNLPAFENWYYGHMNWRDLFAWY